MTSMQRKILISGGARGIGRCLVRRFCERGDKVFVLDINEKELYHTVTVHLKKYSDSDMLGYSVCNLRETADIRKKVLEAAKFLDNRIDVLINNGGIASPKWSDGKTMADPETLDEWFAYIDTNLTAVFTVSQACIPHMAAYDGTKHSSASLSAGACIIHIGSFRSHQSDPNQEGYASSKAGQLGLLHSMAVSLSEMGIRVNGVSPGRIKVDHECEEGDRSQLEWAEQNTSKDKTDHLVNRAGMPDDIADAVEYLVNAGFVTGQEIIVDGGVVIKKAT